MKKGVLVGADEEAGWLLPWFWERYSASNTLPVAFVDFGMKEDTLRWCEERGQVIPFQEKTQDEVLSSLVIQKWEKSYGKSYLKARKAWFKKPAACLLSPFEETLWIDLDCEVVTSIDSVFSFLEGKEVAAALDPGSDEVFNSGVVAFRKGSTLIKKWKDLAQSNGDEFWGDDRVLSKVIEGNLDKVATLPEGYNWRISQGIPMCAKIIHWCGQWGKSYIKEYGGLKELLKQSPALEKIFEIK